MENYGQQIQDLKTRLEEVDRKRAKLFHAMCDLCGELETLAKESKSKIERLAFDQLVTQCKAATADTSALK